MRAQQPFLYAAADLHDSRFPQNTFDPKAITRTSYASELPRPKKQNGPLVSFNRHPDAHVVLSHRSTQYRALSPRLKSWIKGIRAVQLVLRALQLIAALGALALWIIISKVHPPTAWIMRIGSGVVALHSTYGTYHMSRPASDRTPGSSAAYQLFAGISDTCTLPLYAYGVYLARTHGGEWSTLLGDKSLMQYFVPATEYGLLGAGALHLVSLSISVWLGLIFHRISRMPPDLNPLEDRFTSRASHKRNKSSIATASISDSIDKRFSTPSHIRQDSNQSLESFSQRPAVPFMHTRTNSGQSQGSRDSRVDLPSRQYQITPGNSARNSTLSMGTNRASWDSPLHRGSYSAIPLQDPAAMRPNIEGARTLASKPSPHEQRPGKFTETWAATDSLISRTQQRLRHLDHSSRDRDCDPKTYAALTQSYDSYDGPQSDIDDDEHSRCFERRKVKSSDMEETLPQPLQSNPLAPPRAKTSYHPLDHRTLAGRRPGSNGPSNGHDRTNTLPVGGPLHVPPPHRLGPLGKGVTNTTMKSYGQLSPETPPMTVGGSRQVSSGNDYDNHFTAAHQRRNVSGKVAEEGRASYNTSKTARFSGLS